MSARVSVIISSYNRKDTLKVAIKSVLNQSMQDFELIVVDDCSPEDIEKLVKSFGDPRIKFFKTEKNFGHDGQPKNIGIKNATGDYVAFLDDDDKYRVDALKILLTYAVETKVDVVYGDYLVGGKPGWSLDFSPANLRKMNYIAMTVAMVKRESLLAVGGFDEEVPKYKDWNLWLRLQKNGAQFMHVPIIVTEIPAVNPGSISEKFKSDVDAEGKYLPTYFNPADCYIYPNKTTLGTRRPLRVAIYTLTMNRLEYTKKMAAAIDKLAGYPFDWFVIDQGSTDGTQDWIKKLTRLGSEKGSRGKLSYRCYEQNMGLAKGWNNALQWIRDEGAYDILVKVDNDAELMTEGWLKAIVDVYERNRRVMLSPYVEGLDGSPGGVLRQRASGDSPYLTINDHILGLVPNIGGIVMAAPIELFSEWRFDELAAGNKDILLCQYAKANGFFIFYMEEYRVWHIDGTKGQHEKYPEYFNKKSPEESKI